MKQISQIIKPIRRIVFGVLLSGACSVAIPSLATQSVTLAWVASASPVVGGYKIYYRAVSDSSTNVIAVGAVTSAVIAGLREGETYYFYATALDGDSNAESDPSNLTSYTVPGLATLEIQVARENGVATSVAVTASGAIPTEWVLESSADLQHWTTALSGSNAPVNFGMPVTGLPAQFFRLKAR